MNTLLLIVLVVICFIVIIILSLIIISTKKRIQNLCAKIDSSEQSKEIYQSLYERYYDVWNTVFQNVKYPIDNTEKARIIALIWDISSVTIDYLAMKPDNANLLQRNRDSVNFLTRKTKAWANLKDFHRDPTTVPYQVIAMYDILKEVGYKGEIIAFGYKIDIE